MAEELHRNNLQAVHRYYDRTESRLGYRYLLSGTKHFGWYEEGDAAWRFDRALRKMEDQLAGYLALPAGSHVLDAGCGAGGVARALASRHGLVVTGIDILDWNLEESIRKSRDSGLDKRTTFQWGDYTQLDFADATFDGCYTMETLVHADDPQKAVSEFLRVLKPGGRLVHFEYSHPPKPSVAADSWASLELVCRLAAMPAWLMFEDGVLDQMLLSTGFERVHTIDVTNRILPMLKIFAMAGLVPYWVGRHLDKVAKTVNSMSGVEMYRHQDAWRYNITVASKPEA